VTPLTYAPVTTYPGMNVKISVTKPFTNIKLSPLLGWGSDFVLNSIDADGSLNIKVNSSTAIGTHTL
jgi:hypothetical protein